MFNWLKKDKTVLTQTEFDDPVLKNCPFCGSTAALTGSMIRYVKCTTCECQTASYDTPKDRGNMEEFIKEYMRLKARLAQIWNRRVY